jgi:eukaryotic-like serine/threonine-protein kinase
MALAPGARIGTYEIAARIGAGGMGEVYRARDTKLNRDVALKILLELFALDSDRLSRFKREAQVLASLNHPNIAAIYGLEESNGVQALVLELVDGQTLADRIARGPIPIEITLPIAKQIAEALEAAHEQGVIHRDLKPANIKVREDGTVKVLDFGLAKALETHPTDVSQSPTITSPALTRMGVILGTAAYMSPEQARGRAADRRSDMWSFGCLLYEMLTGRRAFEGDEVADTLAAVLRSEPDWSALRPETPAPIRRLLRRCLAKDPRARIGDASIARIEIDDAQSEPQAIGPSMHVVSRRRRYMTWTAAAALVTFAVTGVISWMRRPAATPPRLARFTIALPTGQQFSNPGHRPVAVSPDGAAIVYAANLQLHLRALDQLDAQPIRGSQVGGRGPFFSPDGQWIGFWQGEQFKKISITGGGPVVLCSAPNPWGASWTSENTILYGEGAEGTWRVSADGGKPENIVKVDAGQIASGPQLLPGGRAVLFTLGPGSDQDTRQVVVQSLDTGVRRVVVEAGADGRYVPTGHLVYALRDTLMAVPFDVAKLAVTGGPVALIEDLAMSPDAAMAYFAVSNDGTLVYVPGSGVSRLQRRTLVWVDRQGREAPIKAAPRPYVQPRISPDGSRIALAIRDQEDDIWIWDLARETPMRLTFGPASDSDPIWTPDGQSLFFSSGARGYGVRNLFRRRADGTGTVDQLTHDSDAVLAIPKAVTPDGKGLIFIEARQSAAAAGDQGDLMLLLLEDDQRPKPLLRTPFSEAGADLAPGGRWLAYQSNESGQQEVYVRPFPNVETQKVLVSRNRGSSPVWARNGKELFYVSMGALMSVPVTTGSTFAAGTPAKLFDAPYFFGFGPGRNYDVSSDGQRFLMLKPSDADGEPASAARLVLIQNWFEELKRRVPTK